MSKAVPLLRQGHRIGSPAPAGNTVDYLSEFFGACDARAGCVRPSFITMHAYVTTVDALKHYVVRLVPRPFLVVADGLVDLGA